MCWTSGIGRMSLRTSEWSSSATMVPSRARSAGAAKGKGMWNSADGDVFPDEPARHVHAICATAVADGLLSPNPCQLNVKKPEHLVKPIILAPAEISAAAGIIARRYRAPILIAAHCGLRWGELGELRRSDISDDAATVRVERSFEHDGGCRIDTPKSGKGRTVAVPPHIHADLKHHLDVHTGDDPEALL